MHSLLLASLSVVAADRTKANTTAPSNRTGVFGSSPRQQLDRAFDYPAYVVSLRGNETLRREITALCNAAGIHDVRFVDAIHFSDAKAMAPHLVRGDNYSHVPCPGERHQCAKKVAMWASRQRALRAISLSGQPGLLLEDDVLFPDARLFPRRANALVNEAKRLHTGYDVIYMGHCMAKPERIDARNCHVPRGVPYSGIYYSRQVAVACTHAMFFNAASAARTADLLAAWAEEHFNRTLEASRRIGGAQCRLDGSRPQPSVGCHAGADTRMSTYVQTGKLISLLVWMPLVYQRVAYESNKAPHTYRNRLPDACLQLSAGAAARASGGEVARSASGGFWAWLGRWFGAGDARNPEAVSPKGHRR